MIINAFFILIWCVSINARYILYYSDTHQSFYPTFDCLYAYLIEDGKETGKSNIRNYHLIPYCRRPDYDNDEQDEILHPINENIEEKN